jgi:hypothetical protein
MIFFSCFWKASKRQQKRRKKSQQKKVWGKIIFLFFFSCLGKMIMKGNSFHLKNTRQTEKSERERGSEIFYKKTLLTPVWYFYPRAVVYWWVHFSFLSFYDSFRIFHNFSLFFSFRFFFSPCDDDVSHTSTRRQRLMNTPCENAVRMYFLHTFDDFIRN